MYSTTTTALISPAKWNENLSNENIRLWDFYLFSLGKRDFLALFCTIFSISMVHRRWICTYVRTSGLTKKCTTLLTRLYCYPDNWFEWNFIFRFRLRHLIPFKWTDKYYDKNLSADIAKRYIYKVLYFLTFLLVNFTYIAHCGIFLPRSFRDQISWNKKDSKKDTAYRIKRSEGILKLLKLEERESKRDI